MAGRPTSGDNLWRMLEDEGLFVDEDLQLILKAARSDNLVLLSSFGKDDKLKLEAFMSQTLHKLISREKYVQYYGIYEEKPQLFRFVAGQEKQIDLIAKLCRKIISAGNLASKTTTDTGAALGEASNSQSTQNKPAALSSLISSQSPSQEDKKILHQKEILDKNINNYIKDNFEEELQVSSIVSEDGLGSYNAVVFCPVCESRKKIPKSGSRWNTSNFYLHLRTHVVKEPPTKVMKLDSIFIKDSQGNNRQDQKKKTLTSKSGPIKRKSKSSPISDSDDEIVDDPKEIINVEDSASNKENNLEVGNEASSEGQEGNDESHENGENF